MFSHLLNSVRGVILVSALLLTNLAFAEGPRLEGIFGYAVSATGVTFQVQSGGCTGKGSFLVYVNPERTPKEVFLFRLNADPCRAYLPGGINVSFTYKEMGLNPEEHFRIMNTVRLPY